MANTKGKKVVYQEPSDYFPRELRKKYGIGEFAKKKDKETKKAPKK